jgi:hypothetical protein
MSKVRSPNYPQLSLKEALDKAQVIYYAKHTAKLSMQQIAECLNYTSLNGRSLGVISAIRKYGLLEGSKDSLSISPDAVVIFERPDEHPEKREAIKVAALAPALFNELYNAFGSGNVADADLRIYLARAGFSRIAINDVIKSYRETMALVPESEADYNDPDSEESEMAQNTQQLSLIPGSYQKQITLEANAPTVVSNVSAANLEGFTEDLNYRISDDCKVRVLFSGKVTQEAIEKLIRYLELGKDDFPSKKQLEQQVNVNLDTNPKLLLPADSSVKSSSPVEPDFLRLNEGS